LQQSSEWQKKRRHSSLFVKPTAQMLAPVGARIPLGMQDGREGYQNGAQIPKIRTLEFFDLCSKALS